MKIDTHNLKMTGIKTVSGETKCLHGYYSDYYLQLFYDRSTGEVWTTEHVSLGHNSWTRYHSEDVIDCGFLTSPHTMQEISDIIAESVRSAAEQAAFLRQLEEVI